MKTSHITTKIVMFFIMFFALLPLCVFAQNTKGTIGNCKWEYYNDTKTLVLEAISGTDGRTPSFSDYTQNQAFPDIADEAKIIIIKEGVTGLGSHLFLNFSALVDVQFPQKSLKSLGEGVFRNCDSLTQIEIPESVSEISRALFWDCKSLKNVVLKGGFTSLCEIMLGQCENLETLSIPESVSSLEMSISASGIPRGVFYKDTNLKIINYGGTKDAWQKIIAGLNADSSDFSMLRNSAIRVNCADGTYVYGNVEGEKTFLVPVDKVTAKKLFDIPHKPESPSAVHENYFQGMEIYNNYVFAIYDGGYCRVYELDSGKFIQEFRLECALESNHASGAFFGNYKYSPEDPFPLLYISGDLSTLSCYVERILVDENGKFSSQMVQLIDFSTLKGWNKNLTSGGITTHNGSFVLLEKETDTIVYFGRQLRDIGNANNKVVAAHFRLPLCTEKITEGTVYPQGYTVIGENADDKITINCPVVRFSNDDIIPLENVVQDADGYYYWDYYGRYYQGSYIYKGNVLVSHGINKNYPNYWDNMVFYTGIMAYGYDSDKMKRVLDITGSLDWYGEPQSLVIYNDRIIQYIKGAVYELSVVVEGLKTAYNINCIADDDSVKSAIAEAVKKDIDAEFEVESVVLPENFKPETGKKFTAKVNIYTVWNTGTYDIDVIPMLDFSKQEFSSGRFSIETGKRKSFLDYRNLPNFCVKSFE